jgi:ABC-type branched-subunit amino acid transport system ATPase component
LSAVVEILGLSKRFGGIVVADDIELAMNRGEILGLIGPNGAGKTSLFNLISGIVAPDAGTILINGEPIQNMKPFRRARKGVARTWQNMALFSSMSVLDNLLVAPRSYPGESVLQVLFAPAAVRRNEEDMRGRAHAILTRMNLAALANRPVTDLPFGQQKLIGLARALMNDGDCLLLDEPMAGVEGEAYETMKTVVRQEAAGGRAVCVVEHNVSFVKDLCTTAVFMANGRIIERGSVADLLASSTLAELYFGS